MNFSEWFYAVEADLYHPAHNPSGVRMTPPTRRNYDSLGTMHDFSLENPNDKNTMAYLGHVADVLDGFERRTFAADRAYPGRDNELAIADIDAVVKSAYYAIYMAIDGLRNGKKLQAEEGIEQAVRAMNKGIGRGLYSKVFDLPGNHPVRKLAWEVTNFCTIMAPRLHGFFFPTQDMPTVGERPFRI